MKIRIIRFISSACVLALLCGAITALTSCTDNGNETESGTEQEYTLPADQIF